MANPNTFVQTILLDYMSEHGIDPLSEEGQLFFTSLGLLQIPSPTQTVTITLSAAQIKNWAASVVQVVAAPGVGRVLIPSQVVAQYKRGTVDFTNPGGHAGFNLFYGSAVGAAYSFKEAGADTFFGGGDGSNISALIQDGESGFGWTLVSVASGYLTPQSYFSNAPISVGNIDPLATEYAAGDGTLTITVYYAVITLQ